MRFAQRLPDFVADEDDKLRSEKLRAMVRLIEADPIQTGPREIITVTATYSVDKGVELVLCDGTFTVTLPLASVFYNREITVKNITAGVITIGRSGADLLDGATTQTLLLQWAAFTFKSNGVGWFITAKV